MSVGERRIIGRPQQQWYDDIKKEAGLNCHQIAHYRNTWKNMKMILRTDNGSEEEENIMPSSYVVRARDLNNYRITGTWFPKINSFGLLQLNSKLPEVKFKKLSRTKHVEISITNCLTMNKVENF